VLRAIHSAKISVSAQREKRGAAEVHATDHFCWSGAGWGTKAGFDFVHNKTSSRVRSTDIDVFDLSPDRIGTFDVVLFLGVLYHLTNPYGGLELVYRLTKEVAVIETHVDMLNLRTPVMRFYRGAELNNDPTNFWAPNIACLEGMLKEVGFQRLDWSSADAPVVNKTMTGRQSGRVIVHAWK